MLHRSHFGKRFFLVIPIVFMLLLCACATPEPIVNAQQAIADIGEVALDDQARIEQAEALYSVLTSFQMRRVENAEALPLARQTYDALVEKAASEVTAAIDAIGDVTMDSGSLIDQADQQFSALTAPQQELVKNGSVLQTAKSDFAALQKQVQELDAAIQAVGDVTEESGATLEKLRADVDALEETNRAHLKNVATLEQHERVFSEIMAGIKILELSDYAAAKDTPPNDVITAAELYMTTYPDSSHTPEACEIVIKAVNKSAQQTVKDGDYESALDLLQSKIDQYSGVADVKSLQTLLTKYEKKVKSIEPANGKVLKKTVRNGYPIFSVVAGDQPALIKLVSDDDDSKYVEFYVRAGQSAKVTLAAGSYTLRIASGSTWYGRDYLFGKETSCLQSSAWDGVLMKSERKGDYIYYNKITLPLDELLNGSFLLDSISPDSF